MKGTGKQHKRAANVRIVVTGHVTCADNYSILLPAPILCLPYCLCQRLRWEALLARWGTQPSLSRDLGPLSSSLDRLPHLAEGFERILWNGTLTPRGVFSQLPL